VICLIAATAWLTAQPRQQLLVGERHIAGIVVDPDGTPVVGASIDHNNNRQRTYQTDSQGRFELDTQAPSVVVRKLGFRSELVRIGDARELRVTLQKPDGSRFVSTCSQGGAYNGIEGWGALFQFRKNNRVSAGEQGRDADYASRNYTIDTKLGPRGVRHGAGPMWSFGIPQDRDVWLAVKYDEIVYEVSSMQILDARGQSVDGSRWRYLGRFGESASYSDVDEATAKILDNYMDGACLKSTDRPIWKRSQ